MNSEKPTEQDYKNWHNDPNNWHLGCFYYNPKDKRLLPPKRVQWMGYTVNFANPYSVLLLLPVLVIIVLVLSK